MKTDSEIQRDVMTQLEWDPAIQSAQIGVEVKDGVVTLAGEVSSYAQKWRAERATLRLVGVKALAVQLTVKLPGQSERSDTDIAQAARFVLQWTSSLETDAVKVMVEGGWITLTGEVDWRYQRVAAAKAVRHLMGVVGVSDQIVLRGAPEARIVKADIEAAIRRSVLEDAQGIHVTVAGNDVTLTGRVQSWSERDTATHAAWGSPGVRNVVDNLTLAF